MEDRKQHSEWRVSSNPIAGKMFYQVYRIRNINELEHSGNRETRGCFETKTEAEKLADKLNVEEEHKCNQGR